MARRDSKAEAPEATESTVETDVVEATEADTTEAPVKEAKVEVAFDLTEFKSATTAAVAEADASTGTVPEASLAPVQAAYRDLPSVKAKNKAKEHLGDGMREAMGNNDIATARAFVAVQDSLTAKAPSTPKEPKAPADPTEGFVAKVAGAQLGYALVTADVPDGVASDWSEKVAPVIATAQGEISAYKAWEANTDEAKGEAPSLGYVARSALRVASGKAPGAKSAGTGTPFTGTRRDVGAHIESAFAEQPSGAFLTVAEIRTHKSTEYGDDAPSAGAISARLFPASGKVSLNGVTPGQNEKGVRGATKD
jgi:hypothetical protein